MRQPYDTDCDLVFGPGTATPGVVRSSGPCRLVPENVQIPHMQFLQLRSHYLTLDFDVPVSPLQTSPAPSLAVDVSMADRVAVPSGSVPSYTVLFVESVLYRSNPLYFRAHVGKPPSDPSPWVYLSFSPSPGSGPVNVPQRYVDYPLFGTYRMDFDCVAGREYTFLNTVDKPSDFTLYPCYIADATNPFVPLSNVASPNVVAFWLATFSGQATCVYTPTTTPGTGDGSFLVNEKP